jgi:hypothetical protein
MGRLKNSFLQLGMVSGFAVFQRPAKPSAGKNAMRRLENDIKRLMEEQIVGLD